jgi:hypothetical protein
MRSDKDNHRKGGACKKLKESYKEEKEERKAQEESMLDLSYIYEEKTPHH